MVSLQRLLQINPQVAIAAALAVCGARYLLLFGAAWLDCSLRLSSGTGLLQHPGALSIPIGDAIIFSLSVICARRTSRLGRKLPSTNRAVVHRYYRLRLWYHVLRGRHWLSGLFSATVFVGSLALLNQTVKLFEPNHYGHETFDSAHFIWSFAAQRVSLAISWCFVIPYFVSLLIIHVYCVRTLARRVRQKGMSWFNPQHPDKSGGYAFFGFSNLLYIVGAAVILAEASLTYYTHRKLELANVLAFGFGSGLVIFVSMFAMREIQKTIRIQEVRLKLESFRRTRSERHGAAAYDLLLNYNVRFNAYSLSAAWSITLVRVAVALPAAFNALRLAHLF